MSFERFVGGMNFERFTGSVNLKQQVAMPKNMAVGQIVARKNISRAYRAQLMSHMRKAMKLGMVFSVHDSLEEYAIRRDA